MILKIRRDLALQLATQHLSSKRDTRDGSDGVRGNRCACMIDEEWLATRCDAEHNNTARGANELESSSKAAMAPVLERWLPVPPLLLPVPPLPPPVLPLGH